MARPRSSRTTAIEAGSTCFLGLDVGTSSVKAIVVDARGKIVARASEPLKLRAPQPGWAEQDPDRLVEGDAAGVQARGRRDARRARGDRRGRASRGRCTRRCSWTAAGA